jgi:circadian clock protein KaiC
MNRLPTGTKIDEWLGGGLPVGSLAIIQGRPGSGKTTLAMEFLANIATGRQAIYLTATEPVRRLRVAESEVLGSRSGRIRFLDVRGICKKLQIPAKHGDRLSDQEVHALADAIQKLVRHGKFTAIAIDSITGIRGLCASDAQVREFLFLLDLTLEELGGVGLVISESNPDSDDDPVENYIGDAIIEMRRTFRKETRYSLRVSKLRGSSHSTEEHSFRIGSSGLEFIPNQEEEPSDTDRLIETIEKHAESFDPTKPIERLAAVLERLVRTGRRTDDESDKKERPVARLRKPLKEPLKA